MRPMALPYVPTTSIPACLAPNEGFLCPTAGTTVNETASLQGTDGTVLAADFSIVNANSLFMGSNVARIIMAVLFLLGAFFGALGILGLFFGGFVIFRFVGAFVMVDVLVRTTIDLGVGGTLLNSKALIHYTT